ncbi:acid sphingomyelinase-like phosphodiesterase 3b [Clavelina lepadiformis]|uniref:Acid sphingomyelinase-like phosphodiesterase n=1 Tax=Clavelina lepadiformis TaxID=159417 RepID=A0ABP0GSC1_CLALP
MRLVVLSFFIWGSLARSPSVTSVKSTRANTGTFWHLSDLHLDFYYNSAAADPSEVCPSSYGRKVENAGPYGNYRCDAPWKLINSTVYAMKEINSNPDFILWTGDDTLHTNDQDKYLSPQLVVEAIKNITDLLNEVFPDTAILSSLGNHDYHPKSQLPIGPSWLLNETADLWAPWFTDQSALDTFRENGFYRMSVTAHSDLNIISLNTPLLYTSNKAFNASAVEDPGGQFKWLEESLQNIRDLKQTAYLIGHVPPGYYELVDYKHWYYLQYNEKYINVIKKYSDVISGQFFAHQHSDTFRLFYSDSGAPLSVMWLAPGVTPWMTTLQGVNNGSNNPGIRLFEFDTVTFTPTDYEVYYLDLYKANSDNMATWKLEYRATEDYKISDISPTSMDKFMKAVASADPGCESCESNIMLQKLSLYNSVSYNTAHCDKTCQTNQVCAITEVSESGHDKCLRGAADKVKQTIAMMVVIFLCFFISS